jgi:CheY-like chemotaxis protein
VTEASIVLVVDDDPIVLDVISSLLRQIGFSVLSSDNPLEAFEFLRMKSEIAALVSDFEMPHMNGEQLALAAKKLRPTLPVYILSGKLPPQDPSAAWDRWFVKGASITPLVHQLQTQEPPLQNIA